MARIVTAAAPGTHALGSGRDATAAGRIVIVQSIALGSGRDVGTCGTGAGRADGDDKIQVRRAGHHVRVDQEQLDAHHRAIWPRGYPTGGPERWSLSYEAPRLSTGMVWIWAAQACDNGIGRRRLCAVSSSVVDLAHHGGHNRR